MRTRFLFFNLLFLLIMGIFLYFMKVKLLYSILLLALFEVYAIVQDKISIGSFINSIEDVKNHLEMVVKGDISKDVEYTSDKRMDTLIDKLNGMFKLMRELLTNINVAFDNVEEKSKELNDIANYSSQNTDNISSMIQEVASASQELSATIQEASATLEEITASIEEISANSQSAKENAEFSISVSRNGVDAVNNSLKNMYRINESIKNIAASIETLKKNAKEINGIVDIILNISNQVNLLALNAAIEAARAGEAGRGFAVVASEIRTLSEQTQSSSKNIIEVVESINENIEKLASEIKENETIVTEGVDLIQKSEKALSDIMDKTYEIAEVSEQINKAIHQQSDAIQQLNASIQNISAAAEQLSASSQEGSSAIQNQEEIGRKLLNISNDLEKLIVILNDSLDKFIYKNKDIDN
ncbi:methyl-accepting chemotaxis protein [Caloramator fervidus]|uniref:Methyl-accepting chemotaxis protein n=1 Tax=Caloramator fervidus TaxID=29344 RepID=A0A1H5RLT9_9CLOT|nr:methyl-accepting chemotaxis protein [Caloramator fervidus]SEF39315.1 methyl-accepting chemotaxis protein [Caloramator fervidus]